jgi:ABC-2 type transport system ATP-binding protein
MIKTVNLTKYYKNFAALKNLTLDIQKGHIFGFIGPNGAGKTTTIRILCGLLKQTSGQAFIGDIEVTPKNLQEIKRLVGYLPDYFGVYDQMSVWEFLDFFGAAYKIPTRIRRDRIQQVLELTEAVYMIDYQMNSLSRGMRQRVGIAKTLLHDPRAIILDEPTSGLDPQARIEVRALIAQLRKFGKTVLLSSHILHELSMVCDQIGIIDKGTLLVSGEVEEVLRKFQQHLAILIEVGGETQKARDLLQTQPNVEKVEVSGTTLRIAFKGVESDLPNLLKTLVMAGIPVIWFQEIQADLEQLFLQVTKGAKEHEATHV